MEYCPRLPTVAVERKVGLAALRDGHFIFRFVAPKIHGNSSIKSKNAFFYASICILFAKI